MEKVAKKCKQLQRRSGFGELFCRILIFFHGRNQQMVFFWYPDFYLQSIVFGGNIESCLGIGNNSTIYNKQNIVAEVPLRVFMKLLTLNNSAQINACEIICNHTSYGVYSFPGRYPCIPFRYRIRGSDLSFIVPLFQETDG